MRKDLKSFYKTTIVPSLINEFGYKNIEQVPKISSISINRGFGEAAKNSNKTLQVGSNHRFFESVLYAKKLVDKGTIGEVLSFNGRIGHNGERLKDTWFWKSQVYC